MIKIRIKKRPYGFIYPHEMPDCEFSENVIAVDEDEIAVTGDYMDIANNHCACICTMNITLLLKKYGKGDVPSCSIESDRTEMFKSIHRIVKNGPVIFYKPKLTRYYKRIGSAVRFRPINRLEAIEECINEGLPVAMLVNAGLFLWHWIVVIGVRHYENGDIYLNILDGWNKTKRKYLKFTGRDTFIRALRPVL